MPLETFYNLPPWKQQQVTEAATCEFAENGYVKSSVKAIATRAGVSKGSIYQYFADKKDLFFYIIDLAICKKVELLAGLYRGGGQPSLFETLEAMFLAGLRFASETPNLYRIYHNLRQEPPLEIREELDEKLSFLVRQRYQALVQAAAERGEVRSNISIELAAFAVYILLRHFTEFIAGKEGLSDEEAMIYMRQCLEIIKNGISVSN